MHYNATIRKPEPVLKAGMQNLATWWNLFVNRTKRGIYKQKKSSKNPVTQEYINENFW